MLGRDLEALIQRARDYKKEYGDSFVSVEHLVLGFVQDNRFGKQLFKDFHIFLKILTDAMQAIWGRQTVIDQDMRKTSSRDEEKKSLIPPRDKTSYAADELYTINDDDEVKDEDGY